MTLLMGVSRFLPSLSELLLVLELKKWVSSATFGNFLRLILSINFKTWITLALLV